MNSIRVYFGLRLILTLLLFISCLPTTVVLAGLIFRPPSNEHNWYDWLRFESQDDAFAAAIAIMCVLFVLTLVSLLLYPSARTFKVTLIFSGLLLLFNGPYVLGSHPREISDLVPYAVVPTFLIALKLFFTHNSEPANITGIKKTT